MESQRSTNTTEPLGSFHLDKITLPEFRNLLKYYPETLEQVYRRKRLRKFQPKSKKGSKGTAKNQDDPNLPQEKDLSPSAQADLKAGIEKYMKLDQWRYEEMPALIASRRGSKKTTGITMSKEELINVMEWKTTHGHSRPMLMGMIKSNQDKLVHDCTSAAMAALPTADSLDDEAFPQSSLDALQPLRGVGTATASLILSIMTGSSELAQQIPFYSDEVYIWLCRHEYPEMDSSKKHKSGEFKLKYNLNEYKELWSASVELHRRLNRVENKGTGSEGGSISQMDIEKVAYVLGNIDVSGYYADEGTEVGIAIDTELVDEDVEDKIEIKDSRKRKGEDEEKQEKRKKTE